MELKYMETCHSQYHAGHHLPVVQAYIDGNTAFGELKEEYDVCAYFVLEDANQHLEDKLKKNGATLTSNAKMGRI